MVTTENIKVFRRDGNLGNCPVAADTLIPIGTLAYLDATGFLTGTAGKFFGVAYELGDNAGGADGDIAIDCWQEGVFQFASSGLTQANVGDPAYGVDNDTIGLSASSAFVGIIVRVISATLCEVKLQQSQAIAAATA